MEERVAQVFHQSLLVCLLYANLTGINKWFDVFDKVHHKGAVHFLDKNGSHHNLVQLLHQYLGHLYNVVAFAEDSETCHLVHVEDVINEQILVVVKLNFILWQVSNGLEELLLIANELSYKILGHLYPQKLKLIERILYFVVRMDSE